MEMDEIRANPQTYTTAETHRFTWSEANENEKDENEDTPLNKKFNSNNDQISRTQPAFLRERCFRCFPKFWARQNFLTNREYDCFEAFKEEIQSYDKNNKVHEEELKELWFISFPTLPPCDGLKSKEWLKVGFQGDDPRTDFRGGGILSLHSIVYFFKHYKNNKAEILEKNEEFFFLAATAINLCFGLIKLLNMLDGIPPANLRQYQCTNAQFKKFMRLFTQDKKTFYELHSHSLILLEIIWQKEKSKSELNPMHGFNTSFEQTLEFCKVIIDNIDQNKGSEQIGQLFADLDIVKKLK